MRELDRHITGNAGHSHPDNKERPFWDYECEECGQGADCFIDGRPLCAGHAIDKFQDHLDTFVDRAEEGFFVKYDVKVDGEGELIGYSAEWEMEGCRGEYTNITLEALNSVC